MRLHLPILTAGTLVLAVACAGGGTSPSPAAPTGATETEPPAIGTERPVTSPAISPEPSPVTSPATSPGFSPGASPGASPVSESITVTGVDYAFEGVPSTVPAGTTLSFTNEGSEVHEMVVVRKNEGVTETFEEILTLPDEDAFQLVTVVGGTAAAPGQDAPQPVTVADEGEHLMICFIPQGTTDLGEPIASPGGSPAAESPAAASPGASIPVGPPHFVLGMLQEFQVTEAGSTPGPIGSPGASPGESPELQSPGASPSP